MKQVLATLRHPDGKTVWIPKSKPGARGEPGRPSWRGDWCRAWMRTHVKKFAEFNPAEKTASLDPEPIEVRHMLYARDWESRPPGSKTGTAICERHFRTLWEEICSDGYPEGGSVFKIKIRPARSGFTCNICQRLMELRQKASTRLERDEITFQLKQYLQQVYILFARACVRVFIIFDNVSAIMS